MFGKFLDEISKPAQDILRASGRTAEQELRRELERTITRTTQEAIRRASDEAVGRLQVVGLFTALAPAEPPNGATSTKPSPLSAGGLFAAPSGDSTV